MTACLCDGMASLPWTAWRLLLTYSMLHLGSWVRLMKTSQVSRANGTTHTHQSSVMKEEASLWLWQLVCVMVWHHFHGQHGGCCWLIPCFIWGHESGWWRLHKSLGPMEQLILTNLQWWRKRLLYGYDSLFVWWYGITSMDSMEVVADLFHASFGVMSQVDEDFTSL